MKKKRIFSLILAFVMIMAMAVTAGAVNTGSITIKNATVGEDYAGYKIFNATYSGTNVSYTIKSDSQFYEEVNTATNIFTLTKTSVADTYNVSVAEGADVLTWVKGLNIDGKTPDLASIQAQSATVKWDSVPYGYYYITSSLGTTITVTSNLPDVTVIDKNQKPGGDPSKTAGEEDYQIGETIPFTVTFTATNYDGQTKIENYYVKDTMPTGMELDINSLKVKVNGSDALFSNRELAPLSEPTTSGFDIAIPWQDAEGNFKYPSTSTVTVTYSAKLTSEAAIDGNGNKNSAEITWTGNPEGSKIPVTDTIYTYALAIKKVDKSGNGLQGAEFTLKNGDAEVKVSGADGVYTVDPNGTATITSPESGLIIIKGVDSDKYTLTETKAPVGYNLLTAPVEVTPVKTGATTTNTTIYLDAKGNVVNQHTDGGVDIPIQANISATAYAVVNFTGTELPSTGGIGTIIFYALGAMLAVGAGVILVTKKRVSNKEN